MKHLGKKDNMYPSCCDESKEEPKVRYPSVSLPISLFDPKELILNNEFEFTFKGRIERLDDEEYGYGVGVELTEGEAKSVGSIKTIVE